MFKIKKVAANATFNAAPIALCQEGSPPLRQLAPDSRYYHELVQACQDQEYKGAIYVMQHFNAIFVPTQPAPSSCPMLAYHLQFDDYDNSNDAKVVVDVFCRDLFHRRYAADETFPTGVYTFQQIAQAVDEATADAVQRGPWDLFYNSCFHFAVKLAVALDWDIDNGMLSYISKRLFEHHSTDNIQKAIATPNFVKHFFSRGPVVMKTIQAYFGTSSGLDKDFESSIFMGQLKGGGSDSKLQQVLAVFYDELVKFYANTYIRPIKQ